MKRLIMYEIKNTLGNIFAIIFGVFFPLLLTILVYTIYKSEIPKEAMSVAVTQLYISNLMLIPLALVFVGFAALFSQEIEKGIITRISLFGISEAYQLVAKFTAQAIVLIGTFIFYSSIVVPYMSVPSPTFIGVAALILCLCLLITIIFVMAYAISLLARKFSTAYGITMSIYFGILTLSGMMGLPRDTLPDSMRYISNLLPTAHIGELIPEIWIGNSVNLAPLVQSFLFFGSISFILYAIAVRKNRRVVT